MVGWTTVLTARGRKKKDGSEYLRKCAHKKRADVMQRHTYVLPLQISILYKGMSPKTKENFFKVITREVRKAAEKRWPDADLKGMQLHDDTEYLHVDLWRMKGNMVKHKARGQKEKEVLLFSASSIAKEGAGHGAVYLDRKKRFLKNLHPVDEIKLQGALQAYAERVKDTQKKLPESPADMDWHRAIDAELEEILTQHMPDKYDKSKGLYKDYCKALNCFNYGILDQLDQREFAVKEKEKELEEGEIKQKRQTAVLNTQQITLSLQRQSAEAKKETTKEAERKNKELKGLKAVEKIMIDLLRYKGVRGFVNKIGLKSKIVAALSSSTNKGAQACIDALQEKIPAMQ